MNFTREEQIAIAKVGQVLILADGQIHENEMASYDLELSRIGVTSSEELMEVLNAAESIDEADAYKVIARMDAEHKEYVTAFLGTLIVIDGEKDARELRTWGAVTEFCGLPNMSISDAVQYMKKL